MKNLTTDVVNCNSMGREFIWDKIVPIAQNYDPQFVELMPMGFWCDTQPKEWMEKFERNECGCLSDLNIPQDVLEAYTYPIRYSKEKWDLSNERWDWNYFKRTLFKTERKEIVWDCMLLNLRYNGMSYSWMDKDSYASKTWGFVPSAFERGEQISIMIHPDSHYKGHANCKMWYEFL